MISAATFIKDNLAGAFCLYESMAMWLCLPQIEDMHVLDLGSTDGTAELLKKIAAKNPRVHFHAGKFSHTDAKAFADAANDCIKLTKNDTVLFWQADEIAHQDLLLPFAKMIDDGAKEASFWRYQLRENFQAINPTKFSPKKGGWYPHPVHRLGHKSDFVFVGDGMNTEGYFGPPLVGDYDGGWFLRWEKEYRHDPPTLPTNQMLLDVSLVGAFRDIIPDRRRKHAPFWHEDTNIEGTPINEWVARERHNPNWTKKESPFDIPLIMRWHLGRTRCHLRDDLLQALMYDRTLDYLHTLTPDAGNEYHVKKVEDWQNG